MPASAAAADPRYRGAGGARRERHDAGRVRRRRRERSSAVRGGKWIDGHYGNTLYNHYYPPNRRNWDCGNGSHNKGLSTARSFHAGGVNLLLADGSVRFIRNALHLDTGGPLATREGGETIGDL